MKISTKGRYALRMLIDLAEHRDEGFIALKDIARRQDISKKYLEQIVSILNKPNILIANRGYQGGYKLAQPPKNYTVGDILRITEGGLAPISCLEGDKNLCEKSAGCSTLFIWEGLFDVINEYLDSITLQDVLDHKKDSDGFDYVI
ncbi:MAG: RrF2 family transcriptional regulator [Eubacterium sp.]